MLDRRPEEVIRLAVKGMIPRNRLGRQQLRKLKVYAGPDHPHQARGSQPRSRRGKVPSNAKSRIRWSRRSPRPSSLPAAEPELAQPRGGTARGGHSPSPRPPRKPRSRRPPPPRKPEVPAAEPGGRAHGGRRKPPRSRRTKPAAAEAEAEAEAEPEPEPEPEPEAVPARTLADLAADARYFATGKRKSSVARVIIRPGACRVPRTAAARSRRYFPRRTHQAVVRQPLEVAGFGIVLPQVAARASTAAASPDRPTPSGSTGSRRPCAPRPIRLRGPGRRRRRLGLRRTPR